MTPEARIIIFSTLLSVVLTYCWWVRFRVWIFRQDLFAVRDDLWDEMRVGGHLDDPDYRDFRRSVNSLIRFAPMLSIPTFMWTLFNYEKSRATSLNSRHLEVVTRARTLVFNRVIQYLLLESATGIAILALFFVFGVSMSFKEALSRRVEWLFD